MDAFSCGNSSRAVDAPHNAAEGGARELIGETPAGFSRTYLVLVSLTKDSSCLRVLELVLKILAMLPFFMGFVSFNPWEPLGFVC